MPNYWGWTRKSQSRYVARRKKGYICIWCKDNELTRAVRVCGVVCIACRVLIYCARHNVFLHVYIYITCLHVFRMLIDECLHADKTFIATIPFQNFWSPPKKARPKQHLWNVGESVSPPSSPPGDTEKPVVCVCA